MNKILKSAGLIALGVLSLPSARADDGRLWNAAATVRGFYDDNYNTAPSRTPARRSSYGFEARPQVGFNSLNSWDPTSLDASYTYDLKYYQDRASLHTSDADHSHDFRVNLRHQFPENFDFNADEEFVVSQNPSLLGTPGIPASVLRANGNNIRNSAGVQLISDLSRTLKLDTSYKNNIYRYQDKGHTGSLSSDLDRMEHIADANLMYIMDPQLTWRLGYKFEYHDQTSKDLIGPGFSAKYRNSESHFVYAGADYALSDEVTINGRVGAEYTRFPDAGPIAAANGVAKPGTTVNPYFEAQALYKYSPTGNGTLTVKHERNQTDVGFAAGVAPTLDAESTVVTLAVNQNELFLAEMSGQVLATYQLSQFRGGAANGLADNVFSVQVKAAYEFMKNRLWAEAGYIYDRLDSDLNFIAPRSFYRNQLFLGVKYSF